MSDIVRVTEQTNGVPGGKDKERGSGQASLKGRHVK
jgi:hypothetical protein